MVSSGVLFKIDEEALESKSELEAVYFTKPRLVAYYERRNYRILEPAKKIYYFKKPKLQDYPINLSTPKSNELRFSYKGYLQLELKYAMSSMFKKNIENLKKIKIFISLRSLITVMYSYYNKTAMQKTIRVSRYNSDLYILFGDELYWFKSEADESQQRSSHRYKFGNSIFTESLYYDPNINDPGRSELCGVYQSSFGEFEIIYSGILDGIQAEEEFNDFDDLKALNNCRWVVADIITDSDKDNPQNFLGLWLRAYLTNATDIYFAYVNSDGIVNAPVFHKHISQLPKQFKSHWKPRSCIVFLYKLLQEINTLMSNDNVNSLNTVYEFYINANNTITYKIFKDKPEKFVVTTEYSEYCKKQTSN